MTEDESRGDDVIKPPSPNSPKHSRETWDKLKCEFEAGTYLSLAELSKKWGVNPITLRTRMLREKWNERQRTLQNKVEQKIEKVLVDRAGKYLDETFLRTEKYRKMIDASQEHHGSKTADNTPLLDPEALDVYSRTELRIHELSKSSLKIVDSKEVQHTGIVGIFNVTEAIKALRAQPAPDLSPLELERLKDCKIEGEEGPVG